MRLTYSDTLSTRSFAYSAFRKTLMTNIKIKNESGVLRCEICHKSDYLDSLTNECVRCKDIAVAELVKEKANHREEFSKKPDWVNVIFCIVMIALMPFLAIFTLYIAYGAISWVTKIIVFIMVGLVASFIRLIIEMAIFFTRRKASTR